jgi:imidazolonepropionase-like amidohydrolase
MCLCAPLNALAEAQSVTAKRALDVETGRILVDPMVRIDNGRIVSVGTRAAGERADYDLGDVTLLPGLIDAHTHLANEDELTPDQKRSQTAARAALEGAWNARRVLEAGFTTVRDIGGRDLVDVALRDEINRGHVVGPRMFVATAPISATGGHGDDNALPLHMTVDRYSGVADGPEAVRAKVRQNIKYGADWIKLMATGGVGSYGTDLRESDYTEAEIRAAVEAAREKNRDVAVHAHGTLGILRAARAGVRSIEHASMLDDTTIAAIRKNGTFLVMNPLTNKLMLDRGAAGGYQPYQLEKSRDVYQLKVASLRKAIKARLPLAYGTDSGVQAHGTNGLQFAIYVEAGMTPLQAIQSATLVNARLLRREKDLGKLAKGAFGDLIAVKGNPLENIRALEAPVFVMKEGRVYLKR